MQIDEEADHATNNTTKAIVFYVQPPGLKRGLIERLYQLRSAVAVAVDCRGIINSAGECKLVNWTESSLDLVFKCHWRNTAVQLITFCRTQSPACWPPRARVQ